VSFPKDLIDTLLSLHSVSVSLERLEIALGQLDVYLRKFKNRLKPEHSLHVKQMAAMVRGLIEVASAWAAQDIDNSPSDTAKEELFRINDLTNRMKGGADQINIVSLCRYLKDSQLARKISGYAEKLMSDSADTKMSKYATHQDCVHLPTKYISAAEESGNSPYHAISAFRQVESFLLSLTDADLDGRIILSRNAVVKSKQPAGKMESSRVTLRYMLLNPAEHFQSIIDEARCIVLAGGTMEPVSPGSLIHYTRDTYTSLSAFRFLSATVPLDTAYTL
jgi:chromosome transmission fidelity protein 1